MDHAAFTLSEIVELFLDDSIEIDCLRSRVFDQYPAEDIVNAVFQVKKLVKNEQEPIAIAELIQSYRKIRKFIPLFSARMFQKNVSEEKKRKTRNVDLTAFLVFFMSHYRYFLYGCSSDPYVSAPLGT